MNAPVRATAMSRRTSNGCPFCVVAVVTNFSIFTTPGCAIRVCGSTTGDSGVTPAASAASISVLVNANASSDGASGSRSPSQLPFGRVLLSRPTPAAAAISPGSALICSQLTTAIARSFAAIASAVPTPIDPGSPNSPSATSFSEGVHATVTCASASAMSALTWFSSAIAS